MANSKRQARRAAERKAQKAYRTGQVRQQRRVSNTINPRGRDATHGYKDATPDVELPPDLPQDQRLTEEDVNPGYTYDTEADYAEITIEYCQGCVSIEGEININDPFDASRGINLFVNDSLIRAGHHCTGKVNPQKLGLWKKVVWRIPPALHEKLLANPNIKHGPRAMDIRQWS